MALTMAALAAAFQALEQTRRRGEMVAVLGRLLASADMQEIARVVYLCQGRLRPPFEPLEFGLQATLMSRALAEATGCPLEEVQARYQRLGDLGTVAGELLPPVGAGLRVLEVYDRLYAIAALSGSGAQGGKVARLAELLRQLSALEGRYTLRIVQGQLRLGVGDATILDALAASAGDPGLRALLERCYNLGSDLGLAAQLLREQGAEGLRRFSVCPGRPVRPALAQRLTSPEEVLRRIGRCQVEPKYDGFRLQVHRLGDTVRLFSRSLEDVSGQFPEVAQAVPRQLQAREAILEGEAVGYLPETGEFLPFQVTSQRRRKHNIAAMQEMIPLRLFVFDLLYADGEAYLGCPLSERREALERCLRTTEGETLCLSPALVTADAARFQEFFDEMVAEGLEGVVAKRLDSPYTAGARSYNWIKLKRGYRAELADTVDCVLVGYLLGRGQRARFGIGSLLGAVYNPERDRFETVAKIGSGLSDEGWRRMKEALDAVAVPHRPARVESVLVPDVWCEPRYVVAVQADEITRSPQHTAGRDGSATGYALRFPRVVGWIREDKRPEDATTVGEILDLFRLRRHETTRPEPPLPVE